MEYDCGCWFGADEQWEACCPLHNMPMKLGTIDYADLEWAHRELSKHGVFGVEDIEDWT